MLRSLMFVIAGLVAMTPSCSVAKIKLASDGKTDAVIVIADNAIPAEKTAAQELKRYLKEVTGADFPVVTPVQAAANATRIFVGPTSLPDALSKAIDWSSLGEEGIVIKTVGQDLILAGGRPRGTLYAVYTFMEDVVRCRWWAPNESTIPKRHDLTVNRLNIKRMPGIDRRDVYNQMVYDMPFRVKMKVNVWGGPEEWGGRCTSNIEGAHHLPKLIPVTYYDDHPEWFRYVKSHEKREKGSYHCYTNKDLQKEILKKVLEKLRETDPPGTLIDVSAADNDQGTWCECDECAKLRSNENESGIMVHFLNPIADAVAKEIPGAKLVLLAYASTYQPPVNIKPHDNLIIYFAPMRGSEALPLVQDAYHYAAFKKWRSLAKEMWIWDYTTNFRNYILPHPCIRRLGDDIKLYAQNGITGYFAQGSAGCYLGYFNRLQFWLQSQLLWNPSRSPKSLTKEFFNGYYGKAGPYLLRYMNLMEDAVIKTGNARNLGCFQLKTDFWLKLDTMNKATKLFDQAVIEVDGSPELDSRVKRERISLDLVWLQQYRTLKRESISKKMPFLGSRDPYSAVEEFKKAAYSWGDPGNYREWTYPPFADIINQLRMTFPRPASAPDQCRNLNRNLWEDIQDNMFSLDTSAAPVEIVDDSQASDGKSAQILLNPGDNAVLFEVGCKELPKYAWDDVGEFGEGFYRCYMVARSMNAGSLQEISAGVRHIGDDSRNIEIWSSIDDAYKIYDLGRHKLTGKCSFWISSGSDALQTIQVDRFYLVSE